MTRRSLMLLLVGCMLAMLLPAAAGCTTPTAQAPAESVAVSPDDAAVQEPPTPEPVPTSSEDGTAPYVEPEVPTEFVGIDDDTLMVLGNMTYAVEGQEYPLVDGAYEDEANRTTVRVFPPAALGDLSGDGVEDAAVLLALETGGSGTFKYLAAVLDVNGDSESTEAVALGDRVRITAMNTADGILAMDVVTHGPNDPMCCPTDVQTWMFQVVDGRLELVSEQGPASMTG